MRFDVVQQTCPFSEDKDLASVLSSHLFQSSHELAQLGGV